MIPFYSFIVLAYSLVSFAFVSFYFRFFFRRQFFLVVDIELEIQIRFGASRLLIGLYFGVKLIYVYHVVGQVRNAATGGSCSKLVSFVGSKNLSFYFIVFSFGCCCCC